MEMADLKRKMRRYKLMEKHMELVRKGQYGAARVLMKLLKDNRVTLWLDDDSWTVELICEKAGCRIWYEKNGNRAVAHL